MNPTLALTALALTFAGVALLPVPSTGARWVGSVGAIVCGLIATLLGFGLITT